MVPTTAAGADLVLDLRELLLSRGHPGKCVRCFFGLLGEMDRPGALLPLRGWLEEQLEITVAVDGALVEALPVRLEGSEGIHDFCERAIRTVHRDRAYRGKRIDLGFRYREAA